MFYTNTEYSTMPLTNGMDLQCCVSVHRRLHISAVHCSKNDHDRVKLLIPDFRYYPNKVETKTYFLGRKSVFINDLIIFVKYMLISVHGIVEFYYICLNKLDVVTTFLSQKSQFQHYLYAQIP